MALTPSSMLPLGTIAPTFNLLDPRTKEWVDLASHKGTLATVIIFMCNHCPYVKHIQQGIADLGQDYHSDAIRLIAINANDASKYHSDSPEHMIEFAEQLNFVFPYLYDETQETAQAYHAACTPDCYIFDSELLCVYRGQFDESRPGNSVPVTGHCLREMLEAIKHDQPLPTAKQKPSLGCNIKWK